MQVGAVKALQRSIGNRAAERLLRAAAPPPADVAAASPASRGAAFVADARRMIAEAHEAAPAATATARHVRVGTNGRGPLAVQRVVSKAQFIQDTTSSFIFTWRKGTSAQRTRIEGLLDAYESAKGAVEQRGALVSLTNYARGIVSDSTKFQAAVDKIVKEGGELIDELDKSEEWLEHVESKKRAEEQEREEQKQKELGALQLMDWDGRVAAFKKKYAAGDLFETLIAGTKTLEGSEQLLRLTQNFKNIGFKYTMKAVAPKHLLAGRTDGDCSSVAGAMALIVQEVFLTDAEVNGCKELVVDSKEQTIDSGKAPSAEGGAYWIFNDHYWVESSHGMFDPLFGRVKNEDGWYPRKAARRDGTLKLDVEDYGGDFVIVALITNSGLLNKRASKVTSEEWAEHATNSKITATFEEMRRATGVE